MSKSVTFSTKPAHDWLRRIRISYIPGPTTPMLDAVARNLMAQFQVHGHTVLSPPRDSLDVLVTTATYGTPIDWHEAFFFTAKRRYGLQSQPTIFTLIQISQTQLNELLGYLAGALAKEVADPADYNIFPGLTPRAYHTLHEQGRRGGPILAAARLFQSQAMCLRLIVVVGEDQPVEAYTFDLVGAHPRTSAADPEAFYQDLMLRILTAVSTHEITDHELVEPAVTQAEWARLSVPPAMRAAGYELGKREFFTEMVVVGNLVSIPGLTGAISSQYSEGCFATWEPDLQALITTITGSARPVDKDRLTDDELAVICGVRPDGRGARIRHVAGKRNDPPSSEAVELIEMDGRLPFITLGWGQYVGSRVPVARSKLHGHRGVRSFDPRRAEHVHLTPEFYHYPVSCSTEAQAQAIVSAFSHSMALKDPGDPRQLVFTLLPGHGVVIVEKWSQGKEPFQVIWEAMDEGILEIDNEVPQGPISYHPDGSHCMRLHLE